ncbi:hypothetical protein HOA55_03545 [archaeon]|jgi:hypothetical protein|nr:hypothetical protein [archaeon]MBT3577353.1 hypothetical protein [archaeon]MBT6820404.1 hypothetical protein [archaeon]MBT6956171.1 hypothetical protein [archaeon]MBT7025218.1 hypothetical protein [archaeon]
MTREELERSLRTSYDEIDERLEGLSTAEQQQFLEGLVYAYDSMTRHAGPASLSPVEQQQFLSSAKSGAYSRTFHLDLDPEKHMKGLVESSRRNVAAAYIVAKALQELMGIPLDAEQERRISQVISIAGVPQGYFDKAKPSSADRTNRR